jgi:hypothetical protein
MKKMQAVRSPMSESPDMRHPTGLRIDVNIGKAA